MSSPSQQLVPAQTDDTIIEAVKKLVIDSLLSPNSKASYRIAIDQFIRWYRTEWRAGLNKAAVHAYRAALQQKGLAPSTINARLAAVRKLAFEAADSGYMSHELAAAIGRVKRVPNRGVKTGLWLDKNKAMEFLRLPDTSTLQGKRDYAILCVLIGCGLRREELLSLTFEHIQKREGRWCVVDLLGKGLRSRTVPMPVWAKTAIDDYAQAAAIDQTGLIFRRVSTWTKRREGRPLSTMMVWKIVRKYGTPLGIPLKPHDLRRSFAKLAYKGNAPIPQIQKSLGHSSLITTELYLNIDQNLEDAPCDHLGINPLGDSPVTPTEKPQAASDASSAAKALQKLATKRYLENTTPEQRSTNAAKASAALWDKLSPEERSELARERAASRTPESRSQAAGKAARAKWERMTVEQRRKALETASRARSLKKSGQPSRSNSE